MRVSSCNPIQQLHVTVQQNMLQNSQRQQNNINITSIKEAGWSDKIKTFKHDIFGCKLSFSKEKLQNI